jgi:hypothetical protein
MLRIDSYCMLPQSVWCSVCAGRACCWSACNSTDTLVLQHWCKCCVYRLGLRSPCLTVASATRLWCIQADVCGLHTKTHMRTVTAL